MKILKGISVIILMLSLVACKSSDKIMMSTTTSLNDSGLLDELKKAFKQDTGIDLKWVSVGSGEAIKLARDGGIDVLFAHSPADEQKLVEDGVSLERKSIMFNNFLIVGPKKSDQDLATTVKEICQNELYISRADNSGTHKKELSLFKSYCDDKKPNNYLESGTGMAETLQMASEKQAYTLVDYATWLAQKNNLNLVETFYDQSQLVNTYSIHKISYDKQTDKQAENSQIFIDWLTTGHGLEIIKNYGMEKYGAPVFKLIEQEVK